MIHVLTRVCLVSLLPTLCGSLAACSTPVSPDAGADIVVGDERDAGAGLDGATDIPITPIDVQDAMAVESGVDSASDQGVPDTAMVPDAPSSDVPQGMFNSTVVVDTLFQNCMPEVAPDPLRFVGSLRIMNTGGTPVGPVVATDAVIVTDGLMELARFTVDPVRVDAVAPGTTGVAALTKRADSLTPPGVGCGTVRCDSMVRVRLAISGPGVPPGTLANSPLTRVSCAF